MHTSSARRCASGLAASFLILSVTMPSFGIDLLKWPAGQVPVGQTNGPDGLDDIWQGLFNAWALAPNADADGDGCSNSVESIAGTNPFDPKDCLKVGNTAITSGNVIFTIKVEAGKKYRVLSSDSPKGPTWTAETMSAPVAGTQFIPTPIQQGTVNLVIAKGPTTRKFYKVETSDVDSDGDTVSDWAEYKLGLLPNAQDSDLDGVLDGALVTLELQTPDKVTINATKSIAAEDPLDTGEVTISRARKLLPITVNYSITGTATPGADFSAALVTGAGISEPSPNSVKLDAGKTSAVINVTPIADAAVEAGESVTVTLTSATTTGALTNPTIGFPDTATVIINNSTTASGTGLKARYYDTSSATYADAANFGQLSGGFFVFTRPGASPYTGSTILVPTNYSGSPALAVGTQVKLSFNGGALDGSAFDNQTYAITAVNPGVSFTVGISGAALPTGYSNQLCSFSIQNFPHPGVVERVDPTVNFDWQHGTPNGAVILPNNVADNYSDTFETYLHPTTAGSYRFQLDADDKARVLVDLNLNGTFDLPDEQVVEHNWNVPGSDPVGTFKQGFSLAGASTTANSPVITVPSTTGLVVGMAVSGTGLPSGEFITAIGSGQITVTTGTNVTTQASTTLVFVPNITLAVPGTPAQRYKMRVEHVETTGDARCRLQWSINGGSFANIPTANQFTHTQAMTYSFSGTNAVVIPTGGHSLSAGSPVTLAFSSGVLSTPGTSLGNYMGSYTIGAVNGAGLVTIAGASTVASSAIVTVPSTTGLVVGMAISGTGLPANEFITAIGVGNITVTTGTGVTTQASTTLTATNTFVVPITAFTVPVAGAVTTAGTSIVTVPSTAGLAVGMALTGTGLPANEFITAITQSTPTQPGLVTVTTATGITTQASTTLTAALPAGPVTGAGFVFNNTTSTTTGAFNLSYPNTTFAGSPGRMAVDSAVTAGNNGLWNAGTPDPLIAADTFSVRWTGQVQPQFSEEYTFVVQADDSCALWINGQPQVLKMFSSASTGGSTYTYNATTGDLTVNYSGLATVASSFVAGETVRIDPTSGNLNHNPTNATTYTYDPTTNLMEVDYTNLVPPAAGGTRNAGSYVVGETVELDPTNGSLSALSTLPYVITAVSGNSFTVNAGSLTFTPTLNIVSIATGSSCTITTATNHGLSTGAQVRISSVSGGTFSPAINNLWTVTVTSPNSFTVASNCTVAPTPGTGMIAASGNITVSDNRNLVITSTPTTTSFVVNVGAGKYTDASTGNINIDIVNKALKDWSSNGNERYVRIPMTGGLRYDIQLDMFEATSAARCLLSWFSASQPKQIIPAERLYPSSGVIQPPASTTPTDAVALVGGAFSLPVTGDNGSTVTVGLPSGGWLTFSGGVLSGTPPTGAAGTYQIIVTTTGPAGSGTSVINLVVQENAGNVSREIWSPVSGTTVASIPTGTAPSLTGTLTTLESPVNYGDNYGERLRGYITAPVTGNYYFWIAASNAAELWIANDDDSVNIFRRAWVTTGTNSQEWNAPGETNQKSGWLALEAGKRYYIEVLHKAGVGSDNLAIGWAKPGDATTAPSQIVPSYVLSPYVAPAATPTSGTLYVATMLAQAGAVGVPPGSPVNGVGSATLRLSDDGNTAYMKRTYSGLTGSITSEHIHTDPYLTHSSTIVYDIDMPATPGDGLITTPGDPNFGFYKWTILPVGTLSKADIIEIIKEGKSYINLHTGANPNGEIRGNFTLSNGTRTFTPPPAPPAWTDDGNTDAGAVRFLTQATFGANITEIGALKGLSPSGTTNSRYETWINDQFTKTQTSFLPEVLAREIADVFGSFDVKVVYDTWWKTSMTAQDQLRQKVAFALSQIHVVSGSGPLEDNSRAIAHFYDTLATNAFGNFSNVLTGTTLTPGMGRYLDMLRNDKPDISVGRSPNENYAREIKQLFSIGLYRMWPDGTLMLSKYDAPIDTYSQREIVGLAHVFTGWEYGYDGDYRTSFSAAVDWTRPMREVPARHFTGTKRVLNNEVFPGLTSVGGQPLDPNATHVSTQYNDATYQALPAQELAAAHAMLFNHPNTGPFICRQLIQRMVTSNPSRDYLYRVVQKFNDNGSGVRGDMKAVIKAILLDYEARSPNMITIPAFGKQREPVQRVTNAARALRPANVTGTYSQTAAQYNTSGQPYVLITTSSPHLLSSGNSVFLEFTDTTGDPAKPAPTTGSYTVLSNPAPTSTTYAIAAPGWLAGDYSQTAGNNFITVTMSGHWLPGTNASYSPALPAANFGQALFDFVTAATGTLPADGIRTTTSSTSFDTASGVGNNSGTTFTIPAPDTTARTGKVAICRFPSSYSSTGRNGTITIDTTYSGAGNYGTMANHHLAVGDQVFLNFMNSRDTTSGVETSTENDLVYTITGVPDPNTFTVQARDAANAAMNSDNQVTVFPLEPQPMVRSGTINARPSTYTMDNTDTDLAQTPLNSPTVFNYFLPDYKFAGTLASQGITTPEFQLTSETTVIRQANFFHAAIFQMTSTTGYSSFKNGTNALVMDFSPWMGTTFPLGSDGFSTPTNVNKAWTSNENLPGLIDHLNTLLLAGQLPAAAKNTIINYLNTPISAITVSNPCSITTAAAHGLVNGDSITISGVTGGTFRNSANSATVSINQTFTVTVTSTTAFTLNITGGIRCTSISGLDLSAAYYSPVPYTDTAPTATTIRDRLRNILHLILTSPDYAIQR